MNDNEFNKRVDAAIRTLEIFGNDRAENRDMLSNVNYLLLKQIFRDLKTPEPPNCEHEWDKHDGKICVKCSALNIKTYSCKHGVGFSRPCPECFISTPKETSGYSTENPYGSPAIEWADKVNPEPRIWLERAKENIAYQNYELATKCINEAIELIYGKVE